MKLTDYRIILASNSPRRKELLSGIDVEYETRMLPDLDESYPNNIQQEDVAEFIAKKKAIAYFSELKDDELLITADTIVLIDKTILGKPVDENDAELMLRRLSGKVHKVITGVCLTSKSKQVCFSDISHVTFGELTDEEIRYYLSKYKPFDKAGAYGVQEWIGYIAVEKIEGSYFNVMGLPIYNIYRELKRF